MTGLIKGWLGEKLTTFGLWLRLDQTVYHRIDDIIIPSSNGTTQIDHVLISVFGIFVIETKNMQGWIFGGVNDRTWCQSIYGHKNRFQNPLHQNHRHIQCLADFLRLPRTFFHSIVFFIGDCQFKTEMPPNVLCSALGTYVEGFSTAVLTEERVTEIERKLLELKTDGRVTRSEHLASLEQRHSSTTICPRCGGKLVERKARQSGTWFLGCSNFPRCRHTTGLAAC